MDTKLPLIVKNDKMEDLTGQSKYDSLTKIVGSVKLPEDFDERIEKALYFEDKYLSGSDLVK